MRRTPAFLLLSLLAVPSFAAPPAFLGAWGTCDFGAPATFHPTALAVAPGGSVYVADEPRGRILQFDGSGSLLGSWGSEGSGPGQLQNPQGIAVAPNGDVYVADTFNHRVQHFDSNGNLLGAWGTAGSGPGQFLAPRGIVVLADGDVVVGDQLARLQQFHPDGSLVRGWSLDPLDFSTHMVYGLCRTTTGHLLASATTGLVYEYSASGALLAKWDLFAAWPDHAAQPFGLACTSDGRVLVANASFSDPNVVELTETGAFVQTWGATGSGPGQFLDPTGVAVGPGGEIYVSDIAACRIQKFGVGVVPVKRSTWGEIKSRYR